MKRWLVILIVLFFFGCKSVEVSVERYALPLWNIEGINRLLIAPFVGFKETYRALAVDFAEMTAEFLKTSGTYQSVEVKPLPLESPLKGEHGETLLSSENVMQLVKDFDALLTVQVLSFARSAMGARVRFGFGAGYSFTERAAGWATADSPIEDDLSMRGEMVVAFLLYRMPEGTLKERLICEQSARVPFRLYLFEPERLLSMVFEPIYNRILCHLHIHHSVVKRRFIESSLPLVSHAADAVLCGDLSKAEEVLSEGVKKHPESFEVAYNYALILEAKGFYETALLFYTQAQKLAGEEAFKEEIEDVKKSISALNFHNARCSAVRPDSLQPEPKK
ncbi:MAG: hypothetical protein N2234_10130 [Planctomycetota bacterium]|nr:hypothetical protein [Planctomycetota bacterium]